MARTPPQGLCRVLAPSCSLLLMRSTAYWQLARNRPPLLSTRSHQARYQAGGTELGVVLGWVGTWLPTCASRLSHGPACSSAELLAVLFRHADHASYTIGLGLQT
jgi:hypothetical protein